uniref:Uncharacterized protein n=1 Tax=Pyrodinium bahamense TaxID=73915 RepID=A0A7R9ZVG7_9DINO|mmetsp:Transcript_1144/g.3056  ORF Transcript_1144/g.3056 Transcript_1144/m.3056 type:complete len:259 (+) Transcript_1144:30-806(+)
MRPCMKLLLARLSFGLASMVPYQVPQATADHFGAKQLNGEAPVYDIRINASSTKWILFLEGGGWCNGATEAETVASCARRAGFQPPQESGLAFLDAVAPVLSKPRNGAYVDSCWVHEQNVNYCSGQSTPNCVGWTPAESGSKKWGYAISVPDSAGNRITPQQAFYRYYFDGADVKLLDSTALQANPSCIFTGVPAWDIVGVTILTILLMALCSTWCVLVKARCPQAAHLPTVPVARPQRGPPEGPYHLHPDCHEGGTS